MSEQQMMGFAYHLLNLVTLFVLIGGRQWVRKFFDDEYRPTILAAGSALIIVNVLLLLVALAFGGTSTAGAGILLALLVLQSAILVALLIWMLVRPGLWTYVAFAIYGLFWLMMHVVEGAGSFTQNWGGILAWLAMTATACLAAWDARSGAKAQSPQTLT